MAARAPAVPTPDRNIQLVAWSVLLAAFAAFLALAIGGPLWALHYLRTAVVAQQATAESESGAISIRSGDEIQALDDAAPRPVAEGWTIETFPGSRAFIDFSGAQGDREQLGPTVSLEPGTIVRIDGMRQPRFAWGQAPRRIELSAEAGLSGSGGLVAGTTWDDARLAITTAYARIDLAPESSARIELHPAAVGSGDLPAGDSSQQSGDLARAPLRVVGTEGTITVTNASGQVVLGPDQRTDVRADRSPTTPASGPENIVTNGRFREVPEGNGWEFRRYYPDTPPSLGEASHEILRGGRSVVHFRRAGAEGTSADMYYRQDLGTDVSRARAISITAELQVLGQSVPGGGARGTEYPLILRLHTENAAGEQCDWTTGFYAVTPEPGSEYRIENGITVPLGQWYRFASGDLLDTGNSLAFESRDPPCDRPSRLLWVEISASGHDYESEIDSLEVWVAPR